MDIIKSAIITLLVLVGMFWFVREGTDDPDYITIEYQCSKLDTYEQVPDEVLVECNKRFNKK
jgi:hypothetical protein